MGWFEKLRAGLGKTSGRLTNSIGALFTGKRRLDDLALSDLEDALIIADLGAATAYKLTAQPAKPPAAHERPALDLRATVPTDIAEYLAPVPTPLVLHPPLPITLYFNAQHGFA